MTRFLILAIVWAFLWSGAFVATKASLMEAGPYTTVAVRTVIAGILLLIVRAAFFRDLTFRAFVGFAVVGILNNVGYLGLIATALPQLSVGMAAILTSMTPILVLLIAGMASKGFRIAQVVGCFFGATGVIGSALSRLGNDSQLSAIVLGSIAVVCLVAGTMLTPKLISKNDPWFSTGMQSLLGGIPCLLLALSRENLPVVTPSLVGALAFLVFGATIGAMTIWLIMIHEFGPSTAAIAHFMPPMVSVFLGALILGEQVSTMSLLMCVPVALGVFLATYQPQKQVQKNESAESE